MEIMDNLYRWVLKIAPIRMYCINPSYSFETNKPRAISIVYNKNKLHYSL